jgi:hypothetical protein
VRAATETVRRIPRGPLNAERVRFAKAVLVDCLAVLLDDPLVLPADEDGVLVPAAYTTIVALLPVLGEGRGREHDDAEEDGEELHGDDIVDGL